MDETALLRRLRQGDEQAYQELLHAYGGRLLAVAQRFLRNHDDARDALQETLLNLHRHLDSFQGDSRLSTWLHRIVVNSALMRLRTRRRKPEESIEDLLPRFNDTGMHFEAPQAWPEDAAAMVERSELRALVRARIDELPESYRTVLLLRDIEELDTDETARVLGTTPNAVKIRLHRARQALRTLLDPHLRRGPS
jgi:RNA polymerase sigma-70 factor (ECF subfamily)